MKRSRVYKSYNWYIYILELDNRGVRSRFFGKTHCFYTGITRDIGLRMGTHVFGRDHFSFVFKKFHDARKTPVYVEYFYGNEFEAMKRERQIKGYDKSKKHDMIEGDENVLRGYRPLNWLMLRKPDLSGADKVYLK